MKIKSEMSLKHCNCFENADTQKSCDLRCILYYFILLYFLRSNGDNFHKSVYKTCQKLIFNKINKNKVINCKK